MGPTPAPATSTAQPSRTGRSRAAALPPEQRREAILSATLPLLMEHGMAVTTRQIAEAAGIAEGTIFRVFPAKAALIEAAVAEALDPAPIEASLAAIDAALPLEQRLIGAVRVIQDRVTSVWQLLSILGFMRPPRQDESQRRVAVELRGLVTLLEPDAIQLRSDPESNARQLRALAIAGCHPALIGDDPLRPEQVVSLFLDGVRERTGPPLSDTGARGRPTAPPDQPSC